MNAVRREIRWECPEWGDSKVSKGSQRLRVGVAIVKERPGKRKREVPDQRERVIKE